MIILKLDVTKIDKTKVFEGKKGKYLDLVLHDNKGGRDQYGNDGFIAHSTTKEERAAGTRGAIVGNWKHSGSGIQKPHERPADVQFPPKEEKKGMPAGQDDDDIPF
jgi:hypothetical protein